MTYSKTAIKKTWTIFSIVLSIFALFAANYSKFLEDVVALIKPNNIAVTYTNLFNFSVKLFLILVFIILWGLIYIISLWIFEWKTLSLKKHKITSITSEILKLQSLKSVTIFGYSLSFAEELRFEIENGEKRQINITLIVPSHDFIQNTLNDSQTKASRTEEIAARIKQWNKLLATGRINKIEVMRVDSVPVENGFLINDSIIYIDYYQWEKSGNTFTLKKKPKSQRDFLKIKLENKDIFNYIKYQLDTK